MIALFQETHLAKACDFCGKGTAVGNTVSHANNRTKRKFKANIKTRTVGEGDNATQIKICTKCLKSGKII